MVIKEGGEPLLYSFDRSSRTSLNSVDERPSLRALSGLMAMPLPIPKLPMVNVHFHDEKMVNVHFHDENKTLLRSFRLARLRTLLFVGEASIKMEALASSRLAQGDKSGRDNFV